MVVHLPDGSQHTVTAADVANRADVHNRQYETRAVVGGPTQDEPYVNTGLSINQVLTSFTDPSDVGFTVLERPDGSWSTLSTADVAVPSDFADGLLPAVRVDGSVMEYVRPLRSSDQDVNANDLLRAPQLDLVVHSGALLQVTSSAAPSPAQVDQNVTFSASTAGPEAPTSYAWDFGDGSTGTGATVTHAYEAKGSYRVLATASRADDSAGQAHPLLLTVGAASPSPSVSPAPGRVGPSSSSSAHPRPAGPSAVPRRLSAVTGVTAPSAEAPATLPAPETPVRPAPVGASPQTTATPRPVPTPGTAPLVRGLLIGGSAAVLPGGRNAPGRIADDRHRGDDVPWRQAAGGLAVLLLLGVGATRELRRAAGWPA